ncbi:phage baseplate assembly protein V [Pantoea sesami]|nr:phage baseplate assembly protein V [Pantoea sesami]
MGLDQLSHQLTALSRRVRLMADRALVRIVNDVMQRQNLQVQTLADATNDDVERFQNYGFSSVPPVGSEAIVLAVGGQRENLVAIAVEDKRCRPKGMEPGDVRMYHQDGQSSITLRAGGVIEIAGKRLQMDADAIEMNANTLSFNAEVLNVDAATLFEKDIQVGKKTFLQHLHKDAEGRNTTEPK